MFLVDISLEQIELMEEWSKIALDNEEKIIFMEQFNKTLHKLDIIKDLEIDDVGLSMDRCVQDNILREDKTMPSMDVDLVLGNAPHTQDGMFAVPIILD